MEFSTTSTNERPQFESVGLEAGVWPAESAVYVVNMSMWEGRAPTHRLCNSRLGAVASLHLDGMEAVFLPKERGWIQSSPYKLDARFISKLYPKKKKNLN